MKPPFNLRGSLIAWPNRPSSDAAQTPTSQNAEKAEPSERSSDAPQGVPQSAQNARRELILPRKNVVEMRSRSANAPRAAQPSKPTNHVPAWAIALLVLPFAHQSLSAQQPQYPQYSQYPESDAYGGQYVPNQQPGYNYAQPQPYAQQQPYAQPSYPDQNQEMTAEPDSGPDSGYEQGYAQLDNPQQEPPAQALSAEQLEQLVAPVALYPDTLLAQVLAAATYPAQVVAADHWLQAQGNAAPEQIAAAADAEQWDPSVKALTAFPQVLAQMDHDLQWTTDLGNAYYNQPQDVLQTVQVMRQRSEDAGTLRSTPQETLSYDQGYIQLAPTNPEVVYVPTYNPWYAYGAPIQPYPGFSLFGSLAAFAGTGMRFGFGIGMAAFNHMPFGWAGWGLNWLGQSIFYHQSAYYSRSTSVARWGYPRNGLRGGFGQRAYSQPQRFGNPAYRSGNGYNRQGFARGYSGVPARPGYQAYSHPQSPAMPVRPQTYARPGSSFYGAGQTYAARPNYSYASPQQTWRAPTPAFRYSQPQQRSTFDERAYGSRSFAAPMTRAYAEPPRSSVFRSFGGNHNAERSFGSYHAPKSFGGERHSGGGGHSSGHGGGGHHR